MRDNARKRAINNIYLIMFTLKELKKIINYKKLSFHLLFYIISIINDNCT